MVSITPIKPQSEHKGTIAVSLTILVGLEGYIWSLMYGVPETTIHFSVIVIKRAQR